MSSSTTQGEDVAHDAGFSEALGQLAKAEAQKAKILEGARAEGDAAIRQAHAKAQSIEAKAGEDSISEADRVLAAANKDIAREEAQIAKDADAEVAEWSKRKVNDAQWKAALAILTG